VGKLGAVGNGDSAASGPVVKDNGVVAGPFGYAGPVGELGAEPGPQGKGDRVVSGPVGKGDWAASGPVGKGDWAASGPVA
jgi:hypothetical protein